MGELLVESGSFVFPGERVLSEIGDTTICIGPGLVRVSDGSVMAERAGIVRQRGNVAFYLDSLQSDYVPVKGEYVLGVVKAKNGDYFQIDIGAQFDANLTYLAFEGATKKNRPNVQLGDILFGRMILTVSDTEPEMVCIDSHGKKNGMGVLLGGHMFDVGMHHARRLLSPDCPLLDMLGSEIAFEGTVGMNGKVWIKAKSARDILAVKRAIVLLEDDPDARLQDIVCFVLNWRAGLPFVAIEDVERPELIEVSDGEDEEDGDSESADVAANSDEEDSAPSSKKLPRLSTSAAQVKKEKCETTERQ